MLEGSGGSDLTGGWNVGLRNSSPVATSVITQPTPDPRKGLPIYKSEI